MNTSQEINEVATALAKAQAQMKPAAKDAENPHFRSKYADLASVWEACRGPLTANGITALQDVQTMDDGIGVITRLVHSSGQWIEFGPLVVPLGKRDAHGVGSATSYGKRYALSAAIGIVAEDDDDGNAAAANKPTAEHTERVKPNGYDGWKTILTASPKNGKDALKKAWNAGIPAYRSYFNATEPAGALDKLKAEAEPEAVPA